MAKERIGILGGTFDPIHDGHIHMALSAMQGAHLDRVLVLPTGNPPHKIGITPAEDRWRMVCCACALHDGLTPCRAEIDREGVIYTVDTLSILHQDYPKAELFYLIGTDTLMELHTWRNFEQVLSLCTFVICPRPTSVSPKVLADEQRRLIALGGRFVALGCVFHRTAAGASEWSGNAALQRTRAGILQSARAVRAVAARPARRQVA